MPENNQTKSKNSNGRGGKRANAGRKTGSATKKTREIADRAMQEGVTPLEFMLSIMRSEPNLSMDPRSFEAACQLRFEAAKAAAPYMHPRLAAIEHTAPDGLDVRVETIKRVIVDPRGTGD